MEWVLFSPEGMVVKLRMARWLLLIGAVLMVCIGQSAAQEPDRRREQMNERLRMRGGMLFLEPENPSHIHIVDPKVDVIELQRRFMQAEDQLRKMEQTSLRSKIESLLKKGLDTRWQEFDLQALKRRIQTDEGSKRDLEQWMRGYQAGSNRLPISPEVEKQILEMLKNLSKGDPNTLPSLPTPTNAPAITVTPPTTPPPAIDPADMESRARFARWLTEQAKRLENVEALKNSPALRQASIDLTNYARNKSMKGWERFDFDAQLSKLGVKTLPERLLANLQDSLPRNVTLPRLPRANLPRVNLGWKPTPPRGLPNLGTPSLPSGGDASALLWLAVGGVLLLLLVKLFRSYRPGLADQLGQRLWARRWTVTPDAVRTREDLIQAFEHLSLSRFGIESQSWNHREIAAGLADNAADRRSDADLLADLYEQARYAPADEPLSDHDLANARRALHHLAGASSA